MIQRIEENATSLMIHLTNNFCSHVKARAHDPLETDVMKVFVQLSVSAGSPWGRARARAHDPLETDVGQVFVQLSVSAGFPWGRARAHHSLETDVGQVFVQLSVSAGSS